MSTFLINSSLHSVTLYTGNSKKPIITLAPKQVIDWTSIVDSSVTSHDYNLPVINNYIKHGVLSKIEISNFSGYSFFTLTEL